MDGGGPKREGILTAPLRQVSGIVVSPLPDVTLPAGAARQVCGENPARVALFVQAADLSDIILSPFGGATPAVFGGAGNIRLPLCVHMSVYPSLAQGIWYAYGSVGVVVKVWEAVWLNPQ